jgi:plasmid replication initiation protein
MKKELVVKDNALINASYSLNLVEQRLILLAIVVLREHTHNMQLDYIAFNKPIKVTADSYINTFGVSQSTAYETLKDACKTLFARQFSYQEPRERGRIANKTTRWVSDIAYVDNSATVEFTFAPAVLPLILHLEKHLTSYEITQVSNLTSGYAIRLYELLIAWRSVGKTPEIKLSEFRQKMGVLEGEYQRMGQFKEKVLHIAIEQINEHTDITAEYEQHKEGRSIVGFSFKFKQKQQPKIEKPKDLKRDPNTPDFFIKMTDAQRHLFANKMSEMPEMSSYSKGTESYQQFAIRIADMLLEPEKFRELYPCLEKAGFKP